MLTRPQQSTPAPPKTRTVAGARTADPAESRLRLQTIVRLRWFAVVGQIVTIAIVSLGFGFALPIEYCLTLIVISAWLNVYLTVRYPARHRLSASFATGLLAYDILQLFGLLFLTGGIANPFTVLLVAPVTVSAATLPPRNTLLLGSIGLASAVGLTVAHWPLPWYPGAGWSLPLLYKLGMLAAVCACMIFLALYAWRLSKEARQMSAALAATEHVLAREQKLHALDGLAAAAAHELGTPLATIVLVAKELQREVKEDHPLAEEFKLLQSQAQRCREILQKLTRRPTESDPLHASVTVGQMLEEAAAPHRLFAKQIVIDVAPLAGGDALTEPVAERRPGVIYGLGNLIENAVDFARGRVDIVARWSEKGVTISIGDDGPGFSPDVMDSIGEPYVTTRPSARSAEGDDDEPSGLGLGFFIAKTLLERSGASVTLANRDGQEGGAVVRINWPRASFALPPELRSGNKAAAG